MARIAIVLLLLTSFVWLGCGADEPSSGQMGNTKALEEMNPEERAAEMARRDRMIRAGYHWPEGKPGKRDPVADMEACQQIRSRDPVLADAHPVKQMIADARCMADKGWILDAEAAKAAE